MTEKTVFDMLLEGKTVHLAGNPQRRFKRLASVTRASNDGGISWGSCNCNVEYFFSSDFIEVREPVRVQELMLGLWRGEEFVASNGRNILLAECAIQIEGGLCCIDPSCIEAFRK